MPRNRVNYLQLIHWLGYDHEFLLYQSKHRDISLKRSAYNFARLYGLTSKSFREFFFECVQIGSSIDTSQIGDVVYGEPKGRPF